MECPKKYIYRLPYTKKNGTKVSGACIRSVRKSGTKRADEDQKILRLRAKKTQRAHRIAGGPRSCPDGQRLKKAYSRKTYTTKSGKQVPKNYYPSKCVKTNLTKEQLARKPIILRKGNLGKHGYFDIQNRSDTHRQQSLKKAIAEVGALTVFRKVNILYVFAGKHPNLRKIYKKDKDWVQKNYELKAFTQ